MIIRYRQYGLWLRYSEIYPDKDLVYTVGVSDWTKDWFFAHVGRFSLITFMERMHKYASILNVPFIYGNASMLFKVLELYLDRVKEDGSLEPTTWQVHFQLDSVTQSGVYKLRLAFASANFAVIEVSVFHPILTLKV